MVHQTAGLPIGGVHGTKETPRLWQQPAHCGGPHLGKVSPSVHTAEMGEVADEVQLISHNTKSRILQEAKTLTKQVIQKQGNLSLFLFEALMKNLGAHYTSQSRFLQS